MLQPVKVRAVVLDGQVIEISVDLAAIKNLLGTEAVRSRRGTVTNIDGLVTVTHLRDRSQFFPEPADAADVAGDGYRGGFCDG